MNPRVLLVGLALVVPALIFLGMGLRNDPREIDSPLIGKAAPNFVLTDIDDRVVRLEEFRGRPVVLNFWATWCVPCIAEHPVFASAAQRYRGQAQFLGVIYNDEVADIRRYLAQRGAWGPTLVDVESKTAIAYGVFGVPETFLIDRRGVIVEKIAGAVDPRHLEESLRGLVQ